ncbi:MAG TPA: Lrp/AsnC family transcriptional regulator [archaeon]|nr:Lrp/AsnC family transcriptional regulator [archaeon]
MKELDSIDAKILFELDRNCRQSQKQIAKRVGATRNIVIHRIKKMEEAGVVKGYYTLIDFSKIGYSMVRVYLKLQNTTDQTENKITDFLVKEKSTMTVYKTSASWDIAFVYLVRSLAEFDSLWMNFLKRFKPYIKEKIITLFYGYVHYSRNYLIPEKLRDYSEKITGGSLPLSLSESDLKFLRIIAADGKISLLEISKSLGMTPTAIKFKMRSLEKKGVILAYRAIVDLNKLGYEYYKIDLDLANVSARDQIRKFLCAHPNVVYEDITFGGSDLEFDLEVKSSEEFENFMSGVRKTFPNAVKSFTFYKAREILKYLYMPAN